MSTINAAIKHKYSTVPGQVGTIPPNEDPALGGWSVTDLHDGQILFNQPDRMAYLRLDLDILSWSIDPDPVVEPFEFGWASYSDNASQGTPVAYSILNTNLVLENDAAGPQTDVSHLPSKINGGTFWSSSVLDLSSLTVGSTLVVRVDIEYNPSANNSESHVELLLGNVSPFKLKMPSEYHKTSNAFQYVHEITIYIGSDDVRTGGLQIAWNSDVEGSITVNGWFFDVRIKN